MHQAGAVAGREAPMEVRGAVPPVALRGAERVVRDGGRGGGAGASGLSQSAQNYGRSVALQGAGRNQPLSTACADPVCGEGGVNDGPGKRKRKRHTSQATQRYKGTLR